MVYRPPPSARNGFRNSVFFEQWSAYMDMLMLDANDIIVTGDTNFHLDVFTDADAQRFSDILFEHGMIQLVEDATHKKGHLLDVVIVRDSAPCIIPTLPIVYDPCLCTTNGNLSGDHMAVKFVIDVRKPARLRKKIIFRRSVFQTLAKICVHCPMQTHLNLLNNWFYRITTAYTS